MSEQRSTIDNMPPGSCVYRHVDGGFTLRLMSSRFWGTGFKTVCQRVGEPELSQALAELNQQPEQGEGE